MRLVVGEDSVLFREGLVWLLGDAGHDVVAAVGDADAMEASVRDLRPDVVIADIRMPPTMGSDGARAAARIRADLPDVGILLLSQHIELRECLDLVGTPGFGYLLKDRVLHLAEFDDALCRVGDGGSAIDPEIVRSLVGARRSSALDALSPREVEVLSLVAEGHSNASLASALFLSERTVMAHMRSVFTKLGLVDDGTTHRRVLAVVTYLGSRQIGEPTRGQPAHP
jgi:DNA-binding NarL/FixJ family response regulator